MIIKCFQLANKLVSRRSFLGGFWKFLREAVAARGKVLRFHRQVFLTLASGGPHY